MFGNGIAHLTAAVWAQPLPRAQSCMTLRCSNVLKKNIQSPRICKIREHCAASEVDQHDKEKRNGRTESGLLNTACNRLQQVLL